MATAILFPFRYVEQPFESELIYGEGPMLVHPTRRFSVRESYPPGGNSYVELRTWDDSGREHLKVIDQSKSDYFGLVRSEGFKEDAVFVYPTAMTFTVH